MNLGVAGPGAQDLLKIALVSKADATGAVKQQRQQQTMLLPFVKEFVPIIDEEQQTIYISPPTGLLELAMTAPSKSKKKKTSTKK